MSNTSANASRWPSSRRRRRRTKRLLADDEQTPNLYNNDHCARSSSSSTKASKFELKHASLASLLYCCLTVIDCQSRQMMTNMAAQHNGNSQHGYQLFNTGSIDSQQQHQYPTTTVNQTNTGISGGSCPNGLLTFELATGFIYKPTSAETLAMMPSTLQLTDCLDYCLQNSSCLAINFEMGLCVLLSSSAKQNPQNLYSSQFPVFTIYAEKKCLLQGEEQATKQRLRCQRAWTFERVAGYEMKTRPRRRLKVATKESCMESCLLEREFECRSANWYRLTNECTLSDQDRHSVSQSEASDQQIKGSLHELYGPSNLTAPASPRPTSSAPLRLPPNASGPGGLYQNYYMAQDRLRLALAAAAASIMDSNDATNKTLRKRSAAKQKSMIGLSGEQQVTTQGNKSTRWEHARHDSSSQQQVADNSWPPAQYVVELPAQAPVDYLENNCVYEPNKLCEFRKIQNRVLKTVDSIYQDIGSLDECKQKCLSAPYRCYSFDYGDTSERVCRTSHLDQASLLSVKEPYLDVVGAITYELASCFNVTIQCRAREMVAQVSSSKMFRGKIYVKSRPSSCVNDVRESLKFELSMRYHDENCDVRASSNSQQGVFSNDIIIQHHDRIVTTQDVGLSVYCQYDLGNRSITNNVDLAIDRIDEAPSMEGKTQPGGSAQRPSGANDTSSAGAASGSLSSPLTITSLATTVVRSPNVTMRITNMNGQPMTSATVGDRLALLFEIKEKTSPFGIFVREIVAMDGKQLLAAVAANKNNNRRGSPAGYHYNAPSYNDSASNLLGNESAVENMFQANKANSVQFIDSDGCPTDANIMGPLVKMDPSGHRVLAPFDAFKFPTSDMVFFRAVVTSCVSECKPVVCPPQPGTGTGAGGSGSGRGDTLDQYTTTTELVTTAATMPTTTAAQLDQLISTTLGTNGRNMATSETRKQPAAATESPAAAITTLLNDLVFTEQPQTRRWTQASSSETTASRQSSVISGGDSLTTVPGFGVTEPPVWHTSPSKDIAAQTTNKQQVSNNSALALGAPSQSQSQASISSNKLANTLIESLNWPQRQQLVKLFESKLKQHLSVGSINHQKAGGGSGNNSSLATEMAQIYRNFIASLLSSADSDSASNSILSEADNLVYRSRSVSNDISNNSHSNSSNTNLHTYDASVKYNGTRAGSAPKTQQQLPLDLEGFLLAYLLSSNNFDEQQKRGADEGGNNKLAANVSLSSDQQPADDFAITRQHDAKSSFRSRRNGLSGPFAANFMNPRPNLERPAADELPTPPGAYKSFGKRRRRDAHDSSNDDHEKVSGVKQVTPESISSGFVRVEQQQAATLAPSLDAPSDHQQEQRLARFTRSTVEMYHTHLPSGAGEPRADRKLRRSRREAQPFYEMDEMVVQSIKILDRLHFQDEENEPNVATTRRKSSARSSLVTRWRNGNQTASSLEMNVDNSLGDQVPNQSSSGDESNAEQQSAAQFKLLSWSSSSVLSLLIVASSFVFLQIFLVLVCTIDWSQKQRRTKLTTPSSSGSVSSLSGSSCSNLIGDVPSAGASNSTYCLSTPNGLSSLYTTPEPKTITRKFPVPMAVHLSHSRAIGRREVAAVSSLKTTLTATPENHYYAASSVCRSPQFAGPDGDAIRRNQMDYKMYNRHECTDCVACQMPKDACNRVAIK